MTEPIHSKGTGRSGPKRKTGCLTCRRRKVRCDEVRPTCANCIRLRLECLYTDPKPKHAPIGALRDIETNDHVRRVESDSPDAVNQVQHQPCLQPTHSLPSVTNANPTIPWNFDGESTAAFGRTFQDVFFSLENFDVGGDFVNSDAFLGPEFFSNPHGTSQDFLEVYDTQQGMGNDIENNDRQKALIEYFVKSANPISVILPTHTEWTSVCRSLLAMAMESPFLLSAICALSAIHLYITKRDNSYHEAFQNYKSSSREVNAVLDHSQASERQLKQAFATVFLLAHVELMAQQTSQAKENDWTPQHLQTAHHRVRQHSNRTRLWTGTSKRLLTWMTLLQTKAEYNSGFAALEHSSATLSNSTGDPFAKTPNSIAIDGSPITVRTQFSDTQPNKDEASTDAEDDTRPMAEIAYDTLNQPGFDFYLRSQAFTSRIISLDRYHRNRGIPETELETLKDAQQVSSDLHTLWATRPTTTAFLRDPTGLEDALQPRLAERILLNLRVYVANFYALFIYLHRVAYKTYPATADVGNAITQIIGLAKDILINSGHHRPLQSDEENATGTYGTETGLPATMLWPLFLSAIECTMISDRVWLLQAMRDMDKKQVPNAARTVLLLEEVLRRQDCEMRRIDHRSVRKDLFAGELSVLY